MLKNIIFDLDGTLINSAPSIIECLKVILRKNEIAPVFSLGSKIIGPPLKETLKKLLALKVNCCCLSLFNFLKVSMTQVDIVGSLHTRA